MAKFAKFVANINFLGRLDKMQVAAAEQAVYALKTEVQTAEVVPFDTGATQNNSWVSVSGRTFRLNYSTEYAPKIYWNPEGYTFQTSKNANARSEWLEPWINGEKKSFLRRSYASRFARMKYKGSYK